MLLKPVVDPKTGEVIAEANSDITKEVLRKAKAAGVKEIKTIFFDGLTVGPYLRNTLLIDKVTTAKKNPSLRFTNVSVLVNHQRLKPPTSFSKVYFLFLKNMTFHALAV